MENLVITGDLFSFYKGKKVFITGHTGFKGSWLSMCLSLLGAKVKGYALEPEYSGGIYDLIQPIFKESIIGDVRDKKHLYKEIEIFQPDYIFHLAAQPLVTKSYDIPSETFEVNVVGTAHLLESVRSLEKKCTIIVITTDKVYENQEKDVLYKEEDRLGGYDPYSASKACTELVINSFKNSFFNPSEYSSHKKSIASVRAGNVIGGGDWSKNRIIPDIIKALLNDKPIEIRNPNSIRPWQHVLEPISGYLLLGGKLNGDLSFSKAYNFGPEPDGHLTVKELVEMAIRVWGRGSWKDLSEVNNQIHEAGILKLDITKAKRELNWQPKLSPEDAIKWTIDWYKTETKEKLDFTIGQINKYFSL